jgi:peptidoglycan/LPS O-acetylase OafA/YrhL
MKLSNFTQSRDNNFNLIRIVAALAVLITHSFALAIGSGDAEPFRDTLGMTMGSIAVDIFFITSGFLVTASLLGRKSLVEFFWARTLRIFPALLVMLLVTVLILGPLLTSLSVQEYFADSNTYIYFLKCATLFTGIKYQLPGVFELNPYKDAVNGSLWTMPYEVKMYSVLAITWFTLGKLTGIHHESAFRKLVLIATAISLFALIAQHFYMLESGNFTRLFFMFFSGASYYILKENIKLSPLLFWILLSTLFASSLISRHIFFIAYITSASYLLFYIAYAPKEYIRKYNSFGDYSYGVYIYAFPVQQTVAALVPQISVLAMILISAPVTLALAFASWHLLEQWALGFKGNYVNLTRRLIRLQ